MIVNKRQLATVFGVAEETITQWMKAGMPVKTLRKGTRGNEYETADCIRWFASRGADKESALDINAERARLASEQADRVAMINAERRREVVPLVWMSTVVANKGRQIASILDAIVPNMRRINSALTAEDLLIVDREITKARNLAAQLNLDDADLDELARDSDGADGGAAVAREVDAVTA